MKNGGASSCSIPDSEFTREENIFRCKEHTIKEGPIQSRQSGVLVPFWGSVTH